MAREINLTSNEWCNIIFEGKNKAYGAYTLRQESSKRHLTAFVSVMIAAVLAFTLPNLTRALGVIKQEEDKKGIIDLIDLPKPPEEKSKVELPPPEIEKPKPLISTEKFTDLLIKKDADVKTENELKAMDVINKSDAKISVYTVKGNDEQYGKDLADLDKDREIVNAAPVETDKTYETAEVPPSFPGGDSELMAYLSSHIKYPVIAQEMNIQGKVIVQFVVGKDGSIQEVQIARGVDKSLDEEAMRVVKSMPKWIPGKQGGRPVKVKFFVPVVFRLQ